MTAAAGEPSRRAADRRSRRSRVLVVAAVGVVLLAATLAGLLGGRSTVREPLAAPSPAVHPTLDSGVGSGCPGVLVPAGFVVTDGVPHPDHAPYSPVTLFNPQSVANFALAALNDTRNPEAGRRCLAELAAVALLNHSQTRIVVGANGSRVVARLFPYGFAFSANPSTPTLQPGWVSGIAQGSALSAFGRLYQTTHDPAWLAAGRQVLESFSVAEADGGFTTDEGGVTWYQEYPTTPDSYVLNGHLAAVIALYQWAGLTHDPEATRLADAGLAGARTLLPEFEVTLPQGMLTSYDLLRGRTPAAALRVATNATGASHVTASVPGRSDSTVSVPVTPLRYLSENLADPGVDQDITASRLTPGGSYRLTFRGRVHLTAGQAGSSGVVQAVATCPSGPVTLRAQATIRTQDWAPYDVGLVLPKQNCGLRVHFAVASPSRGTTLDIADVALFELVAPSPGVGVVPLPVSVLQTPDVAMQVTYAGAGGRLEAWAEGRWVTLTILAPSTTDRTVTVALPPWAQGRTLNWGYHELQTAQVAWISRNPGAADPFWAEHGRIWQQLAPADGAELFG